MRNHRLLLLLIAALLVPGCKKDHPPTPSTEESSVSLIRLNDLKDDSSMILESHILVRADSFHPYEGEGWNASGSLITAQERRVVLILPETHRRPPEWKIRFRVRAAGTSPSRTMKVNVQGNEVATFSLSREWHNHQLRLSPQDLKKGALKQLQFYFTEENKSGNPFAEFEYFEFPAYAWGRVNIGSEVRTALLARSKSSLSLPIKIPAGRPYLYFGLGSPDRTEGRAIFRVKIQDKQIFQKEIASTQGWTDEKVDLTPFAGQQVTLQLQAEPGTQSPAQQIAWSSPEIYNTAAKSQKPNIILFSVDTLRADRVSYYDPSRKLTPNLDSVARQSTVFQNAYCTFPSTLSSHTSVMTGLYVSRHQVGRPNEVVPRSKKIAQTLTTVAEVAAERNYFTAAITDGGFVSSFYGFDQGFQQYADNEAVEKAGDSIGTINNAIRWLDTNADRPFFLFLHTYKVHEPFGPPRDTFQKLFPDYPLKPDESPKVTMDWLLRVVEGKVVPTEKQKDFVRKCYEAEVNYFDQVFGRFLGELKKKGLDRNTVILIFGDHGEQLFDRGNGFGHGKTLFVEEMKVPLILYVPGQGHSDRSEVVSLVDIFPTLSQLMGAKKIPPVDGINLLPASGVIPPANRSIYYEVTYGKEARFGIQNHEYKLVLDPRKKQDFFYDIRQDHRETSDIAATSPRALKIMRDLLGAYVQASLTATGPQVKGVQGHEEAGELREQLKALGYLN